MRHRIGSSPWLDGRLDARLAELVAEKLSARAIGEQLGVSRCAVIGRTHRLGLQLLMPSHHGGNPNPHRRRKRKPEPAVPVRAAPKLQPAPKPSKRESSPYLGPRLRLHELRSRQCRYAVDDVSPYWFCSAPTPKGSSWCATHMAVVFGS